MRILRYAQNDIRLLILSCGFDLDFTFLPTLFAPLSILLYNEIVHEASITESMLSLALEKAGEAKAAKITRINLVMGELSGVASDCVQFYFDVISKSTIAEGAALSFETKPTQIRCRKCQKVFTPANNEWACPKCHETSAEIVSGRECYMESIEVE